MVSHLCSWDISIALCEPLSRRISKPTLAADSPNIYLPLQNLMRSNINARLKLQIMPPMSRIRIFNVIYQTEANEKDTVQEHCKHIHLHLWKSIGESEFETGHDRTISPSLKSFPSFANSYVIPLTATKISLPSNLEKFSPGSFLVW